MKYIVEKIIAIICCLIIGSLFIWIGLSFRPWSSLVFILSKSFFLLLGSLTVLATIPFSIETWKTRELYLNLDRRKRSNNDVSPSSP